MTVDDDVAATLDSVTGLNGVATGGTGANMSATGGTGHVVKQASVGAAFTTGTVAAADIGSLTSAELRTILSDETGTGVAVFATSPTLVTPILGTPTSGTLTNCTGLPVATGISGLGSNVATFLATPSSANLATAVTGETGSGALVFATSPTLVTPVLGVATATSVTSTAGAGSETYIGSGVIDVSTTTAQTAADTNETDLYTYTIPANTLNANGRGIRITAWGSLGATANTKTIRIYFGGTVLRAYTLTGNGITWSGKGLVLRTGASSQTGHAEFLSAVSVQLGSTTVAADTTASIIVKVTGQNGTAAAGDIVFSGAIVEFL